MSSCYIPYCIDALYKSHCYNIQLAVEYFTFCFVFFPVCLMLKPLFMERERAAHCLVFSFVVYLPENIHLIQLNPNGSAEKIPETTYGNI